MKITFFILFWILFIIALFLWIGLVNQMNKNERLTEENKNLKEKCENLDKKACYHQLEEENLKAKIKKMEAEKETEIEKNKKHLNNFYSYDGTEQE